MSKHRFCEISSSVQKIAKFKSNYILEISRLRALKLYIMCSYFKSLNFSDIHSGAIAESFRENCFHEIKIFLKNLN